MPCMGSLSGCTYIILDWYIHLCNFIISLYAVFKSKEMTMNIIGGILIIMLLLFIDFMHFIHCLFTVFSIV